jgi:hypothetical protein
MDYVIEFSANSHLGSLHWVVLEIIPPKEVEKSPKVMESIFVGTAGVLSTFTTYEIYILGMITPRFSFEIVGEDGRMHFYVRTQKKYSHLIEAQVYAHFPDAEVLEVEDYVKRFPAVVPNKDWDIWGFDVKLVLPDVYPIKTYKQFEEDITGTMIDPLASMAEVIGAFGPDQHVWLQYVIEPLHETWRKNELKIIDKLSKKAEKKELGVFGHLGDVLGNLLPALWGPVEFAKSESAADQPLEFKLTPGEKELLKAVEENLGKNVFRTKIRFFILGKREFFSKAYVSSFYGSFKQFNDLNLNNFKPDDVSKTSANYILKKMRLPVKKRKLYRRYKDRDMSGVKMILSLTELATIYHFPNMEVKAPSISMVQSRRGAAPANLPVSE